MDCALPATRAVLWRRLCSEAFWAQLVVEKRKNINSSIDFFEEEFYHGAYQDFDFCNSEGNLRKGRLRRVPDFLPVRLQDFLHRSKPDLREQVIFGF